MSQSTADPPLSSSPVEVPLPVTSARPRVPDRAAFAETPLEPAGRERRPGLTPVTLFLTLLVAYVLIKVQLVLILVLLSILLATVIERPVQLIERRRFPRPLAILTVYVAIVASLALFFVLLAPAIGDQADAFQERAPDQLRSLRNSWQAGSNPLLNGPGADLLNRGIEAIEGRGEEVPVAPSRFFEVLAGVGGVIVGGLTAFVIAFYYLTEKAWLRRLVLLEIQPAARARVNRVWDNVEAKVGDWLRGQLTLCLVIGITATIGYGILDIQFWPLLGLWAGITEIIPIIGPWLGGVPAVVIALTQSWNKALLVIGFIVLLQLMENTVLVPRIMRGAVGLTPLTVFLAILTGTQFLGLAGGLLAIPVAAAIQVVIADYLDVRREAQRSVGGQLPGWRWMRGPLIAGAPPPAPVPPPDPAPERPTPTAPPAATGWTSEVLARAGTTTPPRDEQ